MPPEFSKRKSFVEVLLDDEAKVELLCYLVVSQIVALALTDGWMQPEHCVESIRAWLNGSGAQAHWSERVCLAGLSQKVATDFADQTMLPARSALSGLFIEVWQLDYRSSIVRQIHAACENALNRNAR